MQGGGYRFAAIDVGSNAMRLLLARVWETATGPIFKKESLVRFPVRLGDDAFLRGVISAEKSRQLLLALSGFRTLMEAYRPIAYRAVATSAMREADNGAALVEQARERCGVELEIIPGPEEAGILYANHFERSLAADGTYLYVDVGGGSTELTLFHQGAIRASASFDIGTVRLLDGVVPVGRWQEMRSWLEEATRDCPEATAIGSGGNINKIFQLARRKPGKSLSFKRITAVYQQLSAMTLEQRMRDLGLRPDRADVIVPAAEIYLAVLRWAGVRRMHVPQIGLSDGLVHQLYETHRGVADGSAVA